VKKFGRSKNRTFTLVILFFFEEIKTHFSVRNELDKAKVTNSESGGGALSRRRHTGGVRRRSPCRWGNFLQFFPKYTHF